LLPAAVLVAVAAGPSEGPVRSALLLNYDVMLDVGSGDALPAGLPEVTAPAPRVRC
jgi:hypothetical protein